MNRQKPGPARARKGETLAEVLVSLLVATLATLLLAAMVTASARVNIAAKQKDEEFFEALTRVEAMDPDTKDEYHNYTVEIYDNSGPTETLKESIADVFVYSDDDGQLAFYGLDD